MSALCPILRGTFEDYRRDALPAPQRRILRDHLAACPECRNLAAAQDPTMLFARPFAAEEVPAADAARILANVRTAVAFAETERRIRSSRRKFASAAAATAAAAAFGALLLTCRRATATAASKRRRYVQRRRRPMARRRPRSSRPRSRRRQPRSTEFRRTRRFTSGVPAPAGKSLGWSGSWIGGWTSDSDSQDAPPAS